MAHLYLLVCSKIGFFIKDCFNHLDWNMAVELDIKPEELQEGEGSAREVVWARIRKIQFAVRP